LASRRAAVQHEMPEGADARGRILAAGRAAFAAHGFDGTTLREVADRASVQHQLIVYHFGTKLALWKAVVSDICAENKTWLAGIERKESHVGAAAALSELVSTFVRFTARRPELQRMLTFESGGNNERLQWWIDEHVRDFYALSTRLIRAAQAAGEARDGHPGRLHYGVIGIVTTSFVFEQEYRAMSRLNPFSPREIAAVTALARGFLGLR
jgi:TetR/AcrR family transcriptional regulator